MSLGGHMQREKEHGKAKRSSILICTRARWGPNDTRTQRNDKRPSLHPISPCSRETTPFRGRMFGGYLLPERQNDRKRRRRGDDAQRVDELLRNGSKGSFGARVPSGGELKQ